MKTLTITASRDSILTALADEIGSAWPAGDVKVKIEEKQEVLSQ